MRDGSTQSISRGALLRGGGKRRFSSPRSSALKRRESAAWFSRTFATPPALGMAIVPGRCRSQASAIWVGVTPRRFAKDFSNQFLCPTLGIYLGRIDESQAEIQAN